MEQTHPDQSYVAFSMWGMTFGFRIGFDRAQKLHPSKYNMKSALEQPTIMQESLQQMILGPFFLQDIQHLGINASKYQRNTPQESGGSSLTSPLQKTTVSMMAMIPLV